MQSTSFFAKMKGGGRSPLKAVPRTAILGFAGGFAAIALLGLLTDWTSAAWIMAPFGASCVLVFVAWDAPLSQPRNVVGGHLVSTVVGLTVFHSGGSGIWAVALAVGLAIGAMVLTRTTHPPAGANPIVVMMAGSGWTFLIAPVLVGSLMIVFAGLVINNLDEKRKYPQFWL
ncbi:HPP family protein [Paenibacillus sp. MBLB4367]|uniref:HPP family protein n=1 Tax=Paenibacillus sp. MBLB4367 TaxID=3384767 RepID=UPI0039081AD0